MWSILLYYISSCCGMLGTEGGADDSTVETTKAKAGAPSSSFLTFSENLGHSYRVWVEKVRMISKEENARGKTKTPDESKSHDDVGHVDIIPAHNDESHDKIVDHVGSDSA